MEANKNLGKIILRVNQWETNIPKYQEVIWTRFLVHIFVLHTWYLMNVEKNKIDGHFQVQKVPII